MWYGKWAGLARCGDVLLHGNSAGAARHGGVLLVCGDDHMARSSTIATQSEAMLFAPMIPVLAPSGVQEYLDLGIHAYAMSRYSGSWTAFKALDDTVECSASVSVDPARIDVRIPDDFTLPPGGLGLRLPDQPLTMERRIHEQRLPAVLAYARATASTSSRTTARVRGSASCAPASRGSTCARRSATSASTSARPPTSASASSSWA
jgi:indolepyruvate ferredoxin oxidoreductase